ncbi:AAA family ATPase [Kitasatospora sp. NBC_00240]|uniref:ATP-binding protein n=1 Tax=Kitasatospora sp. NBC_00240 TaxID=2903567 RepID=UPI00224FC1CB|nr:LuxR family transcriptional regulator [Kitasatospora sp. NBC_00240]MCX5215407.1 AAA family ATPase [Kitasatospora sp. NBC_00240]
MGSRSPEAVPVGRSTEVAALRALVREVAVGQGRVVWVEGEPGAGKSTLAAAGLAEAAERGCRTACAAADDFSTRHPLRVLLACLAAAGTSGSEQYAEIVRLLSDGPAGSVLGGVDPVLAALERARVLIDNLCADSPLILMIDDIQWADEASMIVWHRLAQAVDQLPLLLIAVSRTAPRRPAVARLRQSVLATGAVLIQAGPLSGEQLSDLVLRMTGAPAGPRLRAFLDQTSGNPLYARELITTLLGSGRIELGPDLAELEGPDAGLPESLAAVVRRRLSTLSPSAREMLGVAALFGMEFSVADLAAVLEKPPSALLTGMRQATTAAVLHESGELLGFRSPVIRETLQDSLPSALRSALHRRIAGVLAESGAPAEQIAQHLLSAGSAIDRWTFEWSTDHALLLARRAPDTAVDLLQRVVDQAWEVDNSRHETAMLALARAYFTLGRHDSVEQLAREMPTRTKDADIGAEMRWFLALLLHGSGRGDQAHAVLAQSQRASPPPPKWQARLRALSAITARTSSGDLGDAETGAREALALAATVDDGLAASFAYCGLWAVETARRDHQKALAAADNALAVLRFGDEYAELCAWAFEGKATALQNLDRLSDAVAVRRDALEDERLIGHPGSAVLHTGLAVQDIWAGRWDDALASLAAIAEQAHADASFGLRGQNPEILHHGATAFIAGHRDDRETARRHLEAGLRLSTAALPDWENSDFLLVAQALEAERGGAPDRALAVLTRLLEIRPGQLLLLHPWLPTVIRLALDLGDTATAREATELSRAEALREKTSAGATAAAAHCRGLLEADPALVLEAANHYEAVGRPFEQAQALEDAAVLTARLHREPESRKALMKAADLYDSLGALWDLRRADTRLRPYSIRRGVRGPRPRASFGWQALTPTELKVAALVAEGKSNPQVAEDLFLSRRTVQTHVSHILAKLGVRSRVGIATEAMRHTSAGTPPE